MRLSYSKGPSAALIHSALMHQAHPIKILTGYDHLCDYIQLYCLKKATIAIFHENLRFERGDGGVLIMIEIAWYIRHILYYQCVDNTWKFVSVRF